MGRGKDTASDMFSSVVGARRGPVSKVERSRREALVQAEVTEQEKRKRRAERVQLLQGFAGGKSVDADGFTSKSGRVMDRRGAQHVETSFLYKDGRLMAVVLIPQIFTDAGLIERRTLMLRKALGDEAADIMEEDGQAVISTLETLDVTEGQFLKGLVQDGLARRGLVRAEVLTQEEALKMVKMTERQRKCLQAVADHPKRDSSQIADLVGDGFRVDKTEASLNGLDARGFIKSASRAAVMCHVATEDGIDYLTMIKP